MNRFEGDVIFRARPTPDGRCFLGDATFETPEGPIPVVTHDGAEVGQVTLVTFINHGGDDGRPVTAIGETDLPPGDYPCGIELDNLRVDAHRGLEMALVDGRVGEYLNGDGDYVEHYFGGRLRRLTVYVGPDAESKPAWPGTHITVTSEGDDR